MNSKWKLIVAVAGLVLLGGGVAAYKTMKLGVPFWRGEQVHDWQMEARISFLATGKRVKARLSLPTSAVEQRNGGESGSLGYHFNIERNLGEYTAIWDAENREDAQALYFSVRFPEGVRSGGEPIPGEAPEPGNPGLSGALGAAADSIVKGAKSISSDPDALFVDLFEQLKRDEFSQEFVLVKAH